MGGNCTKNDPENEKDLQLSIVDTKTERIGSARELHEIGRESLDHQAQYVVWMGSNNNSRGWHS
jgi:hypothetical protein